MASGIIVAAGKGLRMNMGTPKQYLPLGGIPVLSRTLSVFNMCPDIKDILLVVPRGDMEYCKEHILSAISLKKDTILVAGGAERQDSVYNGLSALSGEVDVVVVHDGVRPFITPENITDCIKGAEKFGGCILGGPLYDTLKGVNGRGFITDTPDRDKYRLAQTPQAFKCDLLKEAHKAALKDGVQGTDDAFLVERLGMPVKVIDGPRLNIKITTGEDLILANALMSK